MFEVLRCKSRIVLSATQNFLIEFYLCTDDGRSYGIKSILYENGKMKSVDVFLLGLGRERAEEIISLCCKENVFPCTLLDVVRDLEGDVSARAQEEAPPALFEKTVAFQLS